MKRIICAPPPGQRPGRGSSTRAVGGTTILRDRGIVLQEINIRLIAGERTHHVHEREGPAPARRRAIRGHSDRLAPRREILVPEFGHAMPRRRERRVCKNAMAHEVQQPRLLLDRKCCNFEGCDGGRPERKWAASSQAGRSNSWSMN